VGAATPSIEDHLVRINSRLYLPTDENTNHTGEILSVEGSPFDFREFHAIGERIGENHHQLVCGHGYDHCFVIDKKGLKELEYAATCISPGSGRRMDIYTTEPGMIMYTGNYLSGFHGMHGTTYPRRSAVCFETECYPDTPANLHFPSIVLRKGDIYTQTCIYKFSIQS
ncbi:MAG: galactose-1-epimerase, partial [Muribaculaceae bacterium]|nr:galactose-1-epimerase [Muribaculaceae bacterium]